MSQPAATVTVQPSGRSFSVELGETVLDAAARQHIVLPYGCRNGACGSCKVKVVSGSVRMGPHSPTALPADEQREGFALMCCSTIEGDLTIEARIVEAAGDIAVRKMACRVAAIEPLAPDVMRLRLQLPASERLQYLAGQYVDLIQRDGARRSYSMACAPHLAEQLELHVRHMPGGRFTDALFGVAEATIKVRDILRMEGPLGTFFLREGEGPIVLLASGTGFAPIKALVEDVQFRGHRRAMRLYWGGRRPHDLYMDELCREWARTIPDFEYVPVVSEALPEDGWTGRTGFVHLAVMADLPDLSAHQVYACGTPIMVESARQDFTARCGLPAQAFYADAFTSEADLARTVST